MANNTKDMPMTGKTIKAKDTKPNFGKMGWLLIIAGIICMFMDGSAKNDSLNVIIPYFSETYGWDTATMTLLQTISGYIAAVIMIFIGILARKVGVKKVVVCCGLLIVCAVACYGFIDSLAGYIAIYMCIVIGEVGFGPFGIALLIQNWFPTKKGLAMGYVTIGNNFGSIFINWLLVGSWAMFGHRFGFMPWALIGLVGILIIAFFIKEYPEQHGLAPDNDKAITREMIDEELKTGEEYLKTSPWTVKKLITTPVLWKIGIGVGLLSMCTVGVITHLVPTFMAKGYTQTTAMLIMSIAAVAAIPCSIGLGVIDSKFGTRKAGLLLAIFGVISMVFMAMPFTWSAWIGAAGAAGMMGCTNNLLGSLTSSIFGRYDFQRAFPTLYPIFCIMQSSGLAIVGVLSSAFSFSVPFVVLAIGCLISFILLFTMKDECLGYTGVEKV